MTPATATLLVAETARRVYLWQCRAAWDQLQLALSLNAARGADRDAVGAAYAELTRQLRALETATRETAPSPEMSQ